MCKCQKFDAKKWFRIVNFTISKTLEANFFADDVTFYFSICKTQMRCKTFQSIRIEWT